VSSNGLGCVSEAGNHTVRFSPACTPINLACARIPFLMAQDVLHCSNMLGALRQLYSHTFSTWSVSHEELFQDDVPVNIHTFGGLWSRNDQQRVHIGRPASEGAWHWLRFHNEDLCSMRAVGSNLNAIYSHLQVDTDLQAHSNLARRGSLHWFNCGSAAKWQALQQTRCWHRSDKGSTGSVEVAPPRPLGQCQLLHL
jgi:hypothetical protein